ncbi:MAG: MHYT domain-containing protein [Pseudomonadota bacterium]
MQYLHVGHNPWLVATSLLVALVASATGLTLTKGLSQKSVVQRKVVVALAAVALGGGIWSMHFVAMLGLRLPILFYYDAAITLISALIAILMVALALVILHFYPRTKRSISVAGGIVGLGILAMHYVGMAGMQLCRAVYTPLGILASSVVSIGLCILAFRTAYGTRSDRSIVLGTICFACAVFAVHFLAMASTSFVALPETTEFGPLISNEVLAMGVILTSFVIFGAFLWVGSTYLMPGQGEGPAWDAAPVAAGGLAAPGVGAVAAPAAFAQPGEVAAPVAPAAPAMSSPRVQVPCERDGGKVFVSAGDVAFVRADGHYSQVYTLSERFFCVWPITEATKRLTPEGFIKVHRSYVVNPTKVARFERSKDKGRCSFGSDAVPPVPVSRSHLKDALAAFG